MEREDPDKRFGGPILTRPRVSTARQERLGDSPASFCATEGFRWFQNASPPEGPATSRKELESR